MKDPQLPIEQVPPLHGTDVVQGKNKVPYNLAVMSPHELPERNGTQYRTISDPRSKVSHFVAANYSATMVGVWIHCFLIFFFFSRWSVFLTNASEPRLHNHLFIFGVWDGFMTFSQGNINRIVQNLNLARRVNFYDDHYTTRAPIPKY